MFVAFNGILEIIHSPYMNRPFFGVFSWITFFPNSFYYFFAPCSHFHFLIHGRLKIFYLATIKEMFHTLSNKTFSII